MSEKQLIFNIKIGASQNNLLTYSFWYFKFPHSIEFERLKIMHFFIYKYFGARKEGW